MGDRPRLRPLASPPGPFPRPPRRRLLGLSRPPGRAPARLAEPRHPHPGGLELALVRGAPTSSGVGIVIRPPLAWATRLRSRARTPISASSPSSPGPRAPSRARRPAASRPRPTPSAATRRRHHPQRVGVDGRARAHHPPGEREGEEEEQEPGPAEERDRVDADRDESHGDQRRQRHGPEGRRGAGTSSVAPAVPRATCRRPPLVAHSRDGASRPVLRARCAAGGQRGGAQPGVWRRAVETDEVVGDGPGAGALEAVGRRVVGVDRDGGEADLGHPGPRGRGDLDRDDRAGGDRADRGPGPEPRRRRPRRRTRSRPGRGAGVPPPGRARRCPRGRRARARAAPPAAGGSGVAGRRALRASASLFRAGAGCRSAAGVAVPRSVAFGGTSAARTTRGPTARGRSRRPRRAATARRSSTRSGPPGGRTSRA